MLMGIWKKITEEPTARGLTLILGLLVALGSLYAYFKPSTPAVPHSEQPKAQANGASQSTSGQNSPIVSDNSGWITYSADKPGNPPAKK